MLPGIFRAAAIFRWGTWVVVGGMAFSALANFAAPTAGERFLLGPSALLLAFLCFAATRGHAHPPANFHTPSLCPASHSLG